MVGQQYGTMLDWMILAAWSEKMVRFSHTTNPEGQYSNIPPQREANLFAGPGRESTAQMSGKKKHHYIDKRGNYIACTVQPDRIWR